jgi:hypothetical protein
LIGSRMDGDASQGRSRTITPEVMLSEQTLPRLCRGC